MDKITNQATVRKAFWAECGDLQRKKVGGDYHVDTRVAFVDYVDRLCRQGRISDALAHRVTL